MFDCNFHRSNFTIHLIIKRKPYVTGNKTKCILLKVSTWRSFQQSNKYKKRFNLELEMFRNIGFSSNEITTWLYHTINIISFINYIHFTNNFYNREMGKLTQNVLCRSSSIFQQFNFTLFYHSYCFLCKNIKHQFIVLVQLIQLLQPLI